MVTVNSSSSGTRDSCDIVGSVWNSGITLGTKSNSSVGDIELSSIGISGLVNSGTSVAGKLESVIASKNSGGISVSPSVG